MLPRLSARFGASKLQREYTGNNHLTPRKAGRLSAGKAPVRDLV